MGKHGAPVQKPAVPMRLVIGLGVPLGLIAGGIVWALMGSSGVTPRSLTQPPASPALETAASPSPLPRVSPVPGATVTPAPRDGGGGQTRRLFGRIFRR